MSNGRRLHGRLIIDHCEYPDDLLYDVENGIWVEPRGEVVRVGVTSLLSFSFGVFSAVTFRGIGTPLTRGQVMGTLEGAKHFDVFRSPLTGALSGVNGPLMEDPGVLNRDPYGEGWFAEIRPRSMDEVGALGRLQEVKPRIAQLLRERRVHCYAAFPDFEIFDAGVECQAVLAKLNEFMDRSTLGTVVLVVSDDASADVEMDRWSDQTGNPIVDRRKEGNLYHFVVRKEV